MLANPEPYYLVAITNAQGTIVTGDSNGIDWIVSMNALQSKTGLIGVFAEAPIRLASLLLRLLWEPGEALPKTTRGSRGHSVSASSGSELPERCSLSASSANRLRLSCELA